MPAQVNGTEISQMMGDQRAALRICLGAWNLDTIIDMISFSLLLLTERTALPTTHRWS